MGEDAEHWTMGLPPKPSHTMELGVVHVFGFVLFECGEGVSYHRLIVNS